MAWHAILFYVESNHLFYVKFIIRVEPFSKELWVHLINLNKNLVILPESKLQSDAPVLLNSHYSLR